MLLDGVRVLSMLDGVRVPDACLYSTWKVVSISVVVAAIVVLAVVVYCSMV